MDSEKLCRYILIFSLAIFCSCTARENENNLIANRKIERGNVLCVFAHQDDDAFIISRLKSHSELGDSIVVVYTTYFSHDREKYSQQRISESKKALLTINVNSPIFWDYPDTKTHFYVNEIILRIDSIISKFKPKVIYVPAYEGGNIDHDIANYCVAQLQNKFTKIYEFPLYSAYKTILLPFIHRNYPETLGTEVYLLDKSQYHFVKDYWGIYRSQKFRFELYLRLVSSIKHVFGYEYIRELPHYNYHELPPTKNIAYKRYTKVNFTDFENGINNTLMH
jgi:LmbE family N-acetylglucosaminyl deacetylase